MHLAFEAVVPRLDRLHRHQVGLAQEYQYWLHGSEWSDLLPGRQQARLPDRRKAADLLALAAKANVRLFLAIKKRQVRVGITWRSSTLHPTQLKGIA